MEQIHNEEKFSPHPYFKNRTSNFWLKFSIYLRTTLSSLFAALIFVQCINDKRSESAKVSSKNNANQIDALKLSASRLTGGNFVCNVFLQGDSVMVYYARDPFEHKINNPKSELTQKEYDEYFDSEKTIKKIANGGPVRLLRDNDEIKYAIVEVPFKGQKYIVTAERKKLLDFLKTDAQQLKVNWVKDFADPYIYDDQGREEFFSKFGVISTSE